ncbi:MAG TPA: hypothetical protein PLY16_02510 [Candidatus Saccharibacteria bacterium]|nr:hypothetical protein [Candidatus Saccharibacteria bacterium]
MLLIAASVTLYLGRQYVVDHASMWSFQPSQGISAINDQLDLTYRGQLYFYTAHPELNTANEFNVNCPRVELNNPILGCLHGDRIYIYDIENGKLDGIEEVTAAHEMLHVAWQRLSDDERQHLGKLLHAEQEKITDKAFKERMEYYERNEPGQFFNELHSIIGTEVSDISDELEEYYKKYFNDRQAVVALYENYSSVFENLLNQSEDLAAKIKASGQNLTPRIGQYQRDVEALSDSIDHFNYRASEGDFDSMNQFYQERSNLVYRSNQLSLVQQQLDADIRTYNQLIDQYNSLAIQLESLHQSLDSLEGTAVPSL